MTQVEALKSYNIIRSTDDIVYNQCKSIQDKILGMCNAIFATDIMKNYGVDSKIGLITSTIMGSTETTFYTIAVYTSSIGVKKIRFVLVAALIAD